MDLDVLRRLLAGETLRRCANSLFLGGGFLKAKSEGFIGEQKQNERAATRHGPPFRVPEGATIFHVTHWKAGSQWMYGILREAFGATETPVHFEHQIFKNAIRPNTVYPTAYLTKEELDAAKPDWPVRYFVIIRDLRDTLVSSYFSFRNSHRAEMGWMPKYRAVLQRLNKEDGLLYMIDVWLHQPAAIQKSWIASGETYYRLEEILTDPARQVGAIFQSICDNASDGDVKRLLGQHSFLTLSGGRKPGQEDPNSHYRKGVPGDWREHFSPKVKSRFKESFGELPRLAGYESDDNW